MMHKKLLILFVSLLEFTAADAQKNKDSIPLHYYLQQNFDTTIILHSFSAWGDRPNYRIISIKNNRVYPFTYKTPIQLYNGRGLPKDLTDKFTKRIRTFESTLPDTNISFIPLAIYWHEEPVIKKTLDSLQLWNMADDTKTGEGCSTCGISDSIEYYIWLITKTEIRKLYFYDPIYFENCCPGNPHRKRAIKLVELMNTSFH